MITRILYKRQWNQYLKWISDHARRSGVTVKLNGAGGPRYDVPLALHGVTYDADNDILEVRMGQLGLVIPNPVRIYVDETREHLVNIEVIGASTGHQILHLTPPLGLPPVRTANGSG